MQYQEHNLTFNTAELAGILAVVITVLEEKPDGDVETHVLENSLVSVVEKISIELGLSPVSIPDPIHVG